MFNVRDIPGAEKLNAAFTAAGFELRLVGGAVRDILLNETPKDFDFATDATPDEMKVVAKTADFGCVATGEAHGTMTLVVDGNPFEVTTLRIDVETDGRHAEVEFTRSFEEDAARRDLTFNAMSMDFDGTLFDYFNGQRDLANKVVRFVGDPRQRVEEDFLRILRFFRFAARFSAKPAPEVLNVFKDPQVQAGLRQVSVERFWLEMSKLFGAPFAPVTLSMMQEWKVLETIGLPGEFDLVAFMRADDPASALATFMPRDFTVVDAEAWCRGWKLDRAVTDKVVFLTKMKNVWFDRRTVEDLLVDGVPRNWAVSWVKSTGEAVEVATTFDPPAFPVRGLDLVKRNVKPGPEMGRMLNDMRVKWKQSRFTMTKNDLLLTVN